MDEKEGGRSRFEVFNKIASECDQAGLGIAFSLASDSSVGIYKPARKPQRSLRVLTEALFIKKSY